MTEYDNNSMVTNCCSNLFCINCLTQCKNKCPMCRQSFDIKKCILISDKIVKTKNDTQNKTLNFIIQAKNILLNTAIPSPNPNPNALKLYIR